MVNNRFCFFVLEEPAGREVHQALLLISLELFELGLSSFINLLRSYNVPVHWLRESCTYKTYGQTKRWMDERMNGRTEWFLYTPPKTVNISLLRLFQTQLYA